MFGLKQITLHNSYYNNLTVAVSANGHTNCSGTNAAGKTSMLQLVPFFFGCAPSKFNPKNKDKLPFVDFVLPSSNSLIIYDYHRRDGDCCAVVYRSPRSGAAYRFIKANSAETFFSEEVRGLLKSGATATEVFNKISSLGFEVSTQLLSITEYAAVIQGDVAVLRRLGDKNRVRDAQRFGLASTTQPMRFIGEMTFTLLKRARMYEELKRMIASTLFDYSAPSIPKHRNNERLSRDLKGLREFEQKSDSIKRCVKLHHERLHLQQAIGRYARGVKSGLAATGQACRVMEEQREVLLSEQESYESEYESKKSELTSEKIQAQQSVKSLRRIILSAEEEQERWLNASISEKQADYQNLSDFREEAESSAEHYQLILSDSREIKDRRDSKINDIQKRVNERESAFYADVQQCKDDIEQIDSDTRRKQQALLEEQTEALEQLQQESSEKREGVLPEIGRLKEAIKQGGLNEEERVELAAAEDKLLSHDHKIDLLQEELEGAKPKVTSAKRQHSEALQVLEELRRKLELEKNNIEHLESVLYPADGTLLAELRSNFPEWRKNIGKVIEPSLLSNKSLSPAVSIGENFYGLELNLDALPPPEYAEEEGVLKEKIEDSATKKRLLEEDKSQQEAKLSQLKTVWDEAEQALSQLQHDLKLALSARTAAREHLQRLRLDHKNAVNERKESLKSDLHKLEKQLKEEKKIHQEKVERTRERFADKGDTLFNEGLSARSEIEAKIQQLTENFDVIKERSEKEIKDVQEAYKRQSKDQGVDEKTLNAAKERAENSQKRYKQVQAYGDELERYDNFKRNTWSQVEQQRAECESAELTLERATDALKVLDSERQVRKDQYKKTLKSLEKRLREQKGKLQEAQDLLKTVGAVLDGESEEGDLAALCSELAALLPKEKELRDQVLSAVALALGVVQSNPESKIYEAWKQLSEQRLAVSTNNEFSDEYRLNQPLDLEVLLNQHVPLIREAVIEAIKSVGASFEEFYRTLRQLESDVGRVSRELRKKVNTDQRIAALQNIRLELRSRIATAIDGWEDLQQFIHAWEEWASSMSKKLPPESLEISLAKVISSFQATNIKMDIGSLFDLEIHMVESGRPTCINSNAAFDDASSNGLSYLALIVIFVGLSRYLCPDDKITLTWPVDELATLDPKNVAALFTMLKNNNIEVFSAFPSTDYNLLQHFANRYSLDRKTGAKQFLDMPAENMQVDKLVASLEKTS